MRSIMYYLALLDVYVFLMDGYMQSNLTEFSEALDEMGTCLLEKTALNEDEDSGKVHQTSVFLSHVLTF